VTWWIRQAISRSLSDQSRTIRVPVHMNDQTNKVRRLTQTFLQEHGREPSPAELADRMGVRVDMIENVLRLVREPLSLDAPVGDDASSMLGDSVHDRDAPTPLDAACASELGDSARRMLATLSPREQKVLRLRFGIESKSEHTLEEVGKQFAVTRERIRQIEAKALQKLRHSVVTKRLDMEGRR
jgi:RNA polymerase primary sigma factor